MPFSIFYPQMSHAKKEGSLKLRRGRPRLHQQLLERGPTTTWPLGNAVGDAPPSPPLHKGNIYWLALYPSVSVDPTSCKTISN